MSDDLNLVVKVAMESQSFQQQIANINRQMKVVQSEFANASSKFSEFGSATEKLKVKSASLAQELELAKQKVTMFKEAQDKAKATLDKNVQANEQLKQKIDSVKSAYERSVQATGKNSEESKKLKAELDGLNKKYADNQNTINNNVRTIDNYNIKLNQTEKSVNELTRELKATDKELEVQSSKWTKLSKSMENIGEKSKAIGGKMKNVGQTLTTSITLPLVGIATAAVKVGMDFEAQMSRVKAISGATGDEFKKLEDAALDLGAKTSFSAKQVAEAQEMMASAGFKTNEILSATPGVLDLAASSGTDLATSSNIAASAIRGFGLDASQAGHVADVLAKAAADTNANVTTMGEAFKYVAPIARGTGLSIEEVSAAIGEMADAGIDGSTAGTTLRGAISRLANPSKESATAMAQLGFNAFDSNGKLKSLATISDELNEKMKGLTDQQKQEALATIFGQEAMSGMMVLVQNGGAKLNSLTESLKKSDGAAKEMAKTMQDNTKASIEQMMGSLETAGIKLQQVLAPSIKFIADKIGELADKFSSLSPASQKFILVVVGIAAAIGPVIIIIGSLISAFGVISGAVASASAAIAEAGGIIALLTNPIAIAIGAIVGFIAIFTTLYNTNVEFRNNVNIVWEQIKTTISTIIENIKTIISVFVQVAQDIWRKYGDDIVNVAKTAFDLLASIVQTALDLVSNIIKIVTGVISGDWIKTWEGIKGVVSTVWKGIGDIIKKAIELVKSTISTGLEIAWDTVKRIFNGIKESIMTPIREATNFVKEQVDKIEKFFSGLKIELPPIKLPHFSLQGEFSLEKMTVPHLSVDWYAKGGIFNSPSVIGVGEAGQEAVLPIDRLDDLMARAIEKVGGTNKGITQNITINSPKSLSASETARQNRRVLQELALQL